MATPCSCSTTDSPSAASSIHTVYLGLGSNLGNKEWNISQAVTLIAGQIGTVVRQSALYRSEPWGFQSDHSFVNAVVCVETTLSPLQLLKATQRIERLLGKNSTHATQREADAAVAYHDRPIDIDILLYDQLHVNLPNLHIPHPLMQQRPFVMVPLGEVLR